MSRYLWVKRTRSLQATPDPADFELALYSLTSVLPDVIEAEYEKGFTVNDPNTRMLFKFLGWVAFSLMVYAVASQVG